MFGVDPDSLAGEPAVALSFTSNTRVAGGLAGLAARVRARGRTDASSPASRVPRNP
jgi:hypothetical protein